MRILLVTGSYPPMKCGVGAYTQKLAKALALKGGVTVSVLTDKRAQGTEAIEGVKVHAEIRGWSLFDLVGVVLRVRRLRPDVVHFQYPTQGYAGKMASFVVPMVLRLMGFPCVQTWHEPVLGLGGISLALGLDSLISVKRDLKDHQPAATNWMLRTKPFFWLAGAAMLPVIQLSEDERRIVRRRYTSDDAPWLLVFYGFVAPLKGLETLLDLVAQTGARLVLACDVRSEDVYHRTLLEKISSLKINSQVQITGFLPEKELAMLLSASDAAVFPFRDGAAEWNTSIDGAVAQGTFVLTTTKADSRYDKERHIFYAQVGSVPAMKAALEQYAGRRMSPRSSDAAWGRMADAHNNIYRELIAS